MNSIFELKKIEVPFFDWSIPNKFKVNQKLKTHKDCKVYCHAPYAEELYRHMMGSVSGVNAGKDLVPGNLYECRVFLVTETHALAQTRAGQTVYIDLKKEDKDAHRLGISGIDFTVGTDIQATVRQIGPSYYGSVVESYIQGLKAEFFDQIKKESIAYEAKVESVNKGGYIVDVNGIKCFLPGSLAAANKITDFDAYIGKTFHVMIDGYVQEKDIFVVSYKKYIQKIMDQKIQELDLMKKYKGHVTGTSAFGVFVEWEEIYTGLIHKTEFENQIVIGFKPGDEIEFYIKEIKDDNKVTLTFGEPIEKTKKVYELKKNVDEGVAEVITALVKYRRKNGALIELVQEGLLAMIPQDKLGKESKNMKTGDEIQVKVYAVDPVMNKIYAMPA
jgi:ribosomal protein S1